MSPSCDLDHEDSKNKKKRLHYSGSWCCITIPNSVTKCSESQKISSRQTFTDISNLHGDLDLECKNPIFPQDTLAYNAVLSNQVWLQKDQQFRRYNKNMTFKYVIWIVDPFATKLGLMVHHHKVDCLVKILDSSVVVQVKVTGKVQNSCKCSLDNISSAA